MTFDLDDPRLLLRRDAVDYPGPFYDWLRSESPVWRIPGQDTFLVSDPSLIREAVRRTDDFSSNPGERPPRRRRRLPGGVRHGPVRLPDPRPRHFRSTSACPAPQAAPGAPQPRERVGPRAGNHPDRRRPPRPAPGVESGRLRGLIRRPRAGGTICEVIGLPQSDVPRIVTNVSSVGASCSTASLVPRAWVPRPTQPWTSSSTSSRNST